MWCKESFSLSWAQVLMALLMLVAGVGITSLCGILFTRVLLRLLELPSTSALEQLLGDRPRLDLTLKALHFIVLTVGVAASIVVATSLAPLSGHFPDLLQSQFGLPQHPVECAVEPLLPAVQSWIHPLKCPEWNDLASLKWIALAVFLALLVLSGLATFILAVGLSIAGCLIDRSLLDSDLSWPKEPMSCSFHRLEVPMLFPTTGAELPAPQLHERQDYFISLLLWLMLGAYLLGQLLTWAQGCRALHDYTLLDSGMRITPLEHLTHHLLSASLTAYFLATDHLDSHGLCWEAFLLWLVPALTYSVLQALHFTVAFWDHAKPNLGVLIVEGILPILGEQLEIFKDWTFIGLAARAAQGRFLAPLAVLVLLTSNLYLRKHHPVELARFLLLRAACQAPESFEEKQTSAAKLAIILSKDLPQACLQVIFILLQGGSRILYACLTLSLCRILLCLASRALKPQHHWQSREVLALRTGFSDLLKEMQSRTRLGRAAEALELLAEDLEAKKTRLGPSHAETLRCQMDVAEALEELGRSEESLRIKEEVHRLSEEALGSAHPTTLAAQSQAVRHGGAHRRVEEALAVRREALAEALESWGPGHPDTLKTQEEVAAMLHELGRHQEAFQVLEDLLEQDLGSEQSRILQWHEEVQREMETFWTLPPSAPTAAAPALEDASLREP